VSNREFGLQSKPLVASRSEKSTVQTQYISHRRSYPRACCIPGAITVSDVTNREQSCVGMQSKPVVACRSENVVCKHSTFSHRRSYPRACCIPGAITVSDVTNREQSCVWPCNQRWWSPVAAKNVLCKHSTFSHRRAYPRACCIPGAITVSDVTNGEQSCVWPAIKACGRLPQRKMYCANTVHFLIGDRTRERAVLLAPSPSAT